MFRAADIGRMWVPVELPVSQGGDDPVVWLLQQLFTREELKAREASTLERTAQQTVAALQSSASVDDLRAMMEAAEKLEQADLQEVIQRTKDWRDIVGDDDQQAPFSADKFAAMLTHQWFFRAVRAALFKASREGVSKNSLPGHAGAQARAQA